MAMHNQNGRGTNGGSSQGPTWRPQDEQDMRFREDDRFRHDRDDEFGQGQSGYGAGRFGDDRAMMEFRNRNQGQRPGNWQGQERGFGMDDRFTGGRGGDEYWMDRGDRPNSQWDRRDRDFERNQRERTGYQGGGGVQQGQQQNIGYQRGGDGYQGGFASQGSMGTQGYGQHRGKGPMNYVRSDERIRENVCEALTENEHIDASNIDVVVKNGEVTLTGSVDDRQTKRMAEDVIERCAGVRDVQNQLKVGQNQGNQNVSGTVGKDKARA